MTKIETMDGKTVITTETSRLLRKPLTRRFVAEKKVTGDFFSWLELPDMLLVPARLSFQLDAWKRSGSNAEGESRAASARTLHPLVGSSEVPK
jgi:hypothetical protein